MAVSTRREFLSLSAAGALGLRPRDRMLVCVSLSGGNDGHNTIVPLKTEAANYADYRLARRGLALPQGSLLPIRTPGGETYGLHPSLRNLQRLFQGGNLAVVAAVGPDSSPHLFSHGHQTEEWRKAFLGSAQRVRGDSLSDQLRQVLRTIVSGTSQSLLCSLNGFDTHGGQMLIQAERLAVFDAAIGEFYDSLFASGSADRVTLCTISEFGRSLYPNASEGTNHGWANHHFVLGGAVRGGEVYGRLADLRESRTALIPAMSTREYASMCRAG